MRRQTFGKYFPAWILPAFSMLFCLPACGQGKLYLSGGFATQLTANANVYLGEEDYSFFQFRHNTLDLESESPLIGSFNLLTGATLFNAGYSTDSRLFGSASDLRVVFIGVPLMVRWNVGHKNAIYVDFGWVPTYLVNSHLKESILKFNSVYEVEGDITKYSNRFYIGWKVQFVIPFNRFHVGFYFYNPVKGQSSLRGLEDHWGLNAQQSTYLLANGFSEFTLFGIKMGVRIR